VLPAHAVSAGKALLATLSADALRELYADEALTPLTDRTLPTRTALEAQLEEVRKRGYAVNIGESERGITAAACAIPGRAAGDRLRREPRARARRSSRLTAFPPCGHASREPERPDPRAVDRAGRSRPPFVAQRTRWFF
jgi:hypothetical protein